jgi:hypothetical protein
VFSVGLILGTIAGAGIAVIAAAVLVMMGRKG